MSNGRTQPTHTVRYSLNAPAGGLTPRHVADFVAKLEEIGVGHLADNTLRTVPNSDSMYVDGPLPASFNADAWASSYPETYKALQKARTTAERWARNDIDVLTAMRAICIDLGVDMFPETKSDRDKDDD
ncbi:MAG TPA: hypothetical protein VGS97_20070 [Actinocrinis sp.]|uniref:hypothetical protein n=1 Tax=Actinocrinis sp. TaxID=1920516 RepID=UPI002DDD5249|nr:hypothetical protein [Actinocrinis sp.]HEV2346406.1 hypothetical protein [Actinocrinis sp.]